MPSNKSVAAIAATSPKKSAFRKHSVSKKILSDVTKGADRKVLEVRRNVHSQILFRGIHKIISHMGNNPISILAKNSVKKGLKLKPQKAGIFKKTTARKEVSKALNKEIAKLVTSGSSKPSEVKAKKNLAPVKVLINTEILKKATLSHIQSKSRAKSPSKVSKKISPTREVPPKVIVTVNKASKVTKHASPVKAVPVDETAVPSKTLGRPKRSAKGKKNYSDE